MTEEAWRQLYRDTRAYVDSRKRYVSSPIRNPRVANRVKGSPTSRLGLAFIPRRGERLSNQTTTEREREYLDDIAPAMEDDVDGAGVRWVRGGCVRVGDILTDPCGGHFTVIEIKPDPANGRDALIFCTRRPDGSKIAATSFGNSRFMLHADSPGPHGTGSIPHSAE